MSLSFCSCVSKRSSVYGNTSDKKMKSQAVLWEAEGDLEVRDFDSLGIKISLPKDVKNIVTYSTKEDQLRAGYKELFFDLAIIDGPVGSFKDGGVPVWSGSVRIYENDVFHKMEMRKSSNPWNVETSNSWNVGQIKEAKRQFNVIQTIHVGERRLGLNKTIYFLCEKSNDGRIFTANIHQLELIEKREAEDIKTINILRSISWK